MAQNLRDVEVLIDMFAKLPGLGPRSARRLVLDLIKKRASTMTPLATLLERVAKTICKCTLCGNLSEGEHCHICRNPERVQGQICVVQDVSALWAMERALVFQGRYHILGGTLSALDDIGPEQLSIPLLMTRIQSEDISEVILALGATIDGQTTAHYIAEKIGTKADVTSLAQGVPIGGELEFLDDGTISAALSARKTLV